MNQAVFVCAPVEGNLEANLEKTREYCKKLVLKGDFPVAPVLMCTQFLEEDTAHGRERGIRIGHEMMKCCPKMHVLGHTVTKGMASDIREAARLKLEIIFKEYNDD